MARRHTRVVTDTTILVSAFLRPVAGGAAFELLRLAYAGRFALCLSDEILSETADVLLNRRHLRRRYRYSDTDVVAYCRELALHATMVSDLPPITIVRDPSDDMILATAIAAGADYLVTRDDDLLVLLRHEGIGIVTPEVFLAALRAG